MFCRFALVVALTASAPAATGGAFDSDHPEYKTPHLEPYSPDAFGVISGYHAAVQRMILDRFVGSPYVRLVVLPSFEREWAVDVAEPLDESSEVRFVEATAEIWPTLWPGAEKRQITGKEVSFKIPASLASEIRAGALRELRGVRYPEKQDVLIADGVSYFVAAFEQGLGTLQGRTHSPQLGTGPAALAKVAESLRRLALASDDERASTETELRGAAAALSTP